MFIKYEKGEPCLSDLEKQHNIMCLVGNGFDVAMLNRYRSGIVGSTSRYPDFYKYLNYYYDEELSSNRLYKKMKKEKEKNDKKHEEDQNDNWSDFEELIRQLVYESKETNSYIQNSKDESARKKYEKFLVKIGEDLDQLRNYFSEFLRELIPARVLIDLNNDARENKRAYRTLQGFLCDLDGEEYKSMKFPTTLGKFDLYNYVFFDFNYTMLLDNYLSLDPDQFDPNEHKTVDRNFYFYADPHELFDSCDRLNEGRKQKKKFAKKPILSSYLLMNIIHPHGIQDAPRSMIFGTEDEKYEKNGANKRFIKHHWGQNDLKYKKYFDDAELFIIFGMSLGKSDGWWLGNIYKKLAESDSELIIYKYVGNEDDSNDSKTDLEKDLEIKETFISNCIFYGDEKYSESQNDKESDIYKKVIDQIYIVRHEDNNNCFLGFSDIEIKKYDGQSEN